MVLGMAQMDHKPPLGQYITEVANENDLDPSFRDAQIDDQVMVYPNWNQNCKSWSSSGVVLEKW